MSFLKHESYVVNLGKAIMLINEVLYMNSSLDVVSGLNRDLFYYLKECVVFSLKFKSNLAGLSSLTFCQTSPFSYF